MQGDGRGGGRRESQGSSENGEPKSPADASGESAETLAKHEALGRRGKRADLAPPSSPDEWERRAREADEDVAAGQVHTTEEEVHACLTIGHA